MVETVVSGAAEQVGVIERAYDRIADHAWSIAMEALGDAAAAQRVVVDAFVAHANDTRRVPDLAILATVARTARAGTVAAKGA